MAKLKKICAIIILGLFTIFHVTSAKPDTDVVYKICNGQKFSKKDPIDASIYYVQNDVKGQTSSHGYNYYSSSPGTSNFAYGHGACVGVISVPDCNVCMNEAYKKVTSGCPYNTGAQVQLRDCRIRYEIYPFIE